ncbi:MAG: peptide chain release factor N(5)-glutamine methyltransferase [Lysobacterales bacterium]|nr:MAG: peptide chain release factor N(5)-glutamine methyltransferase [Xanthomonadales bacterium]
MATEIRALLDEGEARLGRVSDEARREAEILLGAALGKSRSFLLAHADERILDCEATDRYEAFVTRRRLGEPIAYILGEREFWSMPLVVRPGVLVPRPETELVVERALAHLPADGGGHVLDLATGSGAIALAIAAERPAVRVLAVDCAAEAVELARENAVRLGLAGRVEVRQGSWFEPSSGLRFGLIASNPPYVAEGDPRLAASVRRHEPRQALYSGPGGLEALTAIVADAPGQLEPDGWLVLEHGNDQAAAVRALLAARGYADVATFRDLAGHERCTEGRYPGGS